MNLEDHRPKHDFFIAIDSDGCAFDTMELKHKECFIPNIIKHWNLQAVSNYTRQSAEFVNLYSKWRGINRFPALAMCFDLLAERSEVKARGVALPEIPNLRRWIETESRLGNPALEAYCEEHDEADMQRALAWSVAVNDSVTQFVKGVPPFPKVRESLELAGRNADLLVCSATPCEALLREWEEHGLAELVFSIAGQEHGKKDEHIAQAAGGKYASEKMLMIGDAPGDLKAADANGAFFYPIMPGAEEASWDRFFGEGLERFFSGDYGGEFQDSLIRDFDAALPHKPPWK